MAKDVSRRDLIKAIALASLATTSSATASAERQDGAKASAGRSDQLRIADQPVEATITFVSAHTVRLTITAIGSHVPDDGVLRTRPWPAPALRVAERSHPATVRRGDLTADWQNDLTLRISYHGRVVQEVRVDPDTGAIRFLPGSGPLLGLGQGGPQFDRRGQVDRMRSGQGGYQLRTHGGKVPIPWLMSPEGWALFVRYPYGPFDLSSTTGRVDPVSPASALPTDIFIVSSADPTVLMSEYAELTGYPEMPPLWAFGYQQSHRTLASRDEVLQEAKTFREKRLPCDALIYLGTGFCPSGWNTNNGEFAFNPKVFPDPAEMVKALHDDHFKVVLHAVLEGRTLSGTVTDSCTAAALPSGRLPDGKWPDDRQVACYWPVHTPILGLGIDGWWPDQGDGLDLPSRLARNRMYWDGCQMARPDERPYALHRNGAAGLQRYAAFLWSGDVYSTWETLATHVPDAINTGLSGIPFWGTDIGGFVPTKEFTGELYVRWFQFAAFCPLFRAHGRTWKLRLPWGWNTGGLEPDEIANYTGGAANPDVSELHNAAVEPICRKYLELRYRLLPYLYSAVHEAHTTGLPIIRSLWLHHRDEPAAAARGDEYLWARDILVAPVVEAGATKRRVYLPRGIWYDFWTNERFDGGHEIDRVVDLETLPLFVRAGAVLPLGPVKQYTAEPVDAPLTLQVYPGADGSFRLYEDDGVSYGYQRGDWMAVDIRWEHASARLSMTLAEGSRMRPPSHRPIMIRMAVNDTAREVTFTGSPLSVQL